MSAPTSPLDDSLEAQIREARSKAALFSKSLQEARDQEALALKTLEDERLRWTQSFEEKSILIDQLEQELTSTVDALDEERKTARTVFHRFDNNVHEQNDRIRTSGSFDRESHYDQSINYDYNRQSVDRNNYVSPNVENHSSFNSQQFSSNNESLRPHASGYSHKIPIDYRDIDRVASLPRMERVTLHPPHKDTQRSSLTTTIQPNHHEQSSSHYISDMDKDYDHIHRNYKELKSQSPPYHHQSSTTSVHHSPPLSTQHKHHQIKTDSPTSPSPDNNHLWKELYTQCNLQLGDTKQLLAAALSEFEQVKLDLLKTRTTLDGRSIEVNKLKEERDQFAVANRDLQGRMEFRMQQVIDLEDSRLSSEHLTAQLKTQIDTLSSQLVGATSKITSKDSEITSLRGRVQALEDKLSYEMKTRAGFAADSLLSAREEQQSLIVSEKLGQAEKVIGLLNDKLESLQQHHLSELSQAKQIAQSLQLQLKDSEHKCDEYSRRVIVAEQRSEEKDNEIIRLNNTIKNMQNNAQNSVTNSSNLLRVSESAGSVLIGGNITSNSARNNDSSTNSIINNNTSFVAPPPIVTNKQQQINASGGGRYTSNDEDDDAESTPRAPLPLLDPQNNSNSRNKISPTSDSINTRDGGGQQHDFQLLSSMYQKVSSPLTVNSGTSIDSGSGGGGGENNKNRKQTSGGQKQRQKEVKEEQDWELLEEEAVANDRHHNNNKNIHIPVGIAARDEYFDHDDVVNHSEEEEVEYFDHHGESQYFDHDHTHNDEGEGGEDTTAGDILLNNSNEHEEYQHESDSESDDEEEEEVHTYHSSVRAPAPPPHVKTTSSTTSAHQLHHSPSYTHLLTLQQAESFHSTTNIKNSHISDGVSARGAAVSHTSSSQRGSVKGSSLKKSKVRSGVEHSNSASKLSKKKSSKESSIGSVQQVNKSTPQRSTSSLRERLATHESSNNSQITPQRRITVIANSGVMSGSGVKQRPHSASRSHSGAQNSANKDNNDSALLLERERHVSSGLSVASSKQSVVVGQNNQQQTPTPSSAADLLSKMQHEVALQHKLSQQRDMQGEEHRFKFRDDNMVVVNGKMAQVTKMVVPQVQVLQTPTNKTTTQDTSFVSLGSGTSQTNTQSNFNTPQQIVTPITSTTTIRSQSAPRGMHSSRSNKSTTTPPVTTRVNPHSVTAAASASSTSSMTRKMSSTPTNVTPRGENKLKSAASAHSLSSLKAKLVTTNHTTTKKNTSSSTPSATPTRSNNKDPLPSFTPSSQQQRKHSGVGGSGGDKDKKSKKIIRVTIPSTNTSGL